MHPELRHQCLPLGGVGNLLTTNLARSPVTEVGAQQLKPSVSGVVSQATSPAAVQRALIAKVMDTGLEAIVAVHTIRNLKTVILVLAPVKLTLFRYVIYSLISWLWRAHPMPLTHVSQIKPPPSQTMCFSRGS